MALQRPNKLSFDFDCRKSIARLWTDAGPIGTAFYIGPQLALTCHHCVSSERRSLQLRQEGPGGVERVTGVDEIIVPRDPMRGDAALLRLSGDVPHWLATSTAEAQQFGELVAFGYPGIDPKQGLIRIDLELRGAKQFEYHGYALPEALALAGDPAAPGMSGGPVLDVNARVAIAMIVGGPDFDNRAVALPFWALDNTANRFPAFGFAARSNRGNTVQHGWSMNYARATLLCSGQIEAAAAKLTDRGRFDATRTVRRERLMATIAQFLTSKSPVLIVISDPNSGKTSAMIGAALEIRDRSLFLEAFQVDDIRATLVSCLDHGVQALADAVEGETVEVVARALSELSTKLTIFVDGINEIDDNVGKVESWLSEAITESDKLGAKLIVSCRSDFWNDLAISQKSFVTHELGYFNDMEAKRASELYGLGAVLGSELGRHPLLFRIVSNLGSSSDLLLQGRFSAIPAFMKRIIALSPGVRNSQRLFEACARMVRDLGNDEETIPWDVAANHLGGSKVVDNLIEGGLLRSRERETVRFMFDEMMEVIRPRLPQDQTSLVHIWTQALTDERAAIRAAGALVRATFEGDSGLVSKHSESFETAYRGFLADYYNCLRLAHTGLGPSKTVIDRIYVETPSHVADTARHLILGLLKAIVECLKPVAEGHFNGGVLASSIKGLAIPTAWKFDVLSELLALCPDTELREKDLFDRGHKADLLKEAERSSSVAGALLKLVTEDPREARRLALPKLDDQRRLGGGGEATVGGVLASILRISAEVEFDDLLSLLLEATNIQAARRLIGDISSDHPALALAHSVAALSTSRAVAVMDKAIAPSLTSLGPGMAPLRLVDELRKVLSRSTPGTRLKAAALIRLAEPDDLEAWDEVATMAQGRDGEPYLYPVPAARAQAFINVLRSRRDRYAIDQMRFYDGDDRVESKMAQLALELLEALPTLSREIAGLVEHKLYLVKRSAVFSDWLNVAYHVANYPDPETRRKLLYYSLAGSDPTELQLRLWADMLSGPTGLGLVEEAFRMLYERHKIEAGNSNLRYFEAIADQHGPTAFEALSSWLDGQASLFGFFDNDGSDHARLNHLLELLVERTVQTHPEFLEKVGHYLEQSTDWVEFFRQKLRTVS